MRVGEWNTIIGHPELDQHEADQRNFVITELQVEADNNLPKDVEEKAHRLFRQNHWRTADTSLEQASAERGVRYTNRFTCVRRGIQIVPKYDPRTDLPRTDMQYVTVIGPANQEIHCDERGRVNIRFPGCRPRDHAHDNGAGASHTERDSAWVQVASHWAGMQYGSLSLPRVGDQVLCVFVGGDPDESLIIGRAHSGNRPPPVFSRVSQLPGDRYLSGIVSKEGGKPAAADDYRQRYNQLRMDDTPGEISAQLASAHGQSQLNLGYLTHPRSNGHATPRGAGFELATNDSGAIRTAKSLLLSAWKRLDACGTQLDRAEHLALMQDCLDLFKTLGQYAVAHQGTAVDEGPQTALKAALSDQDAQPTLSMTAPAGLALTTPAAIVSYAGKNIDSVALQHLQLASGERLQLHSGKALSLFAHSDGIRQIAHKGN